jgi:hypothetical protein
MHRAGVLSSLLQNSAAPSPNDASLLAITAIYRDALAFTTASAAFVSSCLTLFAITPASSSDLRTSDLQAGALKEVEPSTVESSITK